MPFYEYQCRACGEQTEVLQKISDPPLKKCPACGKNQLDKLVSAPVFRLKGGGWYETDFKSDAERKRNLAGAEKEGGGEAATDKPAAEKPAEKKTEPAAAEAKPAAKPVRKAARPAAKPARSAAKKAAARR